MLISSQPTERSIRSIEAASTIIPRVERSKSPKNGPLLGSSRMYCREATVTKIATISRTPEKNRVNRSTWNPPKDTGEELVNPSHTVDTRAMVKPKIQTKGARPSFDFLNWRNPAGVASSPNTARLRKGVSERMAGSDYLAPNNIPTVVYITLPSRGVRYSPNSNKCQRNDIRVRIQ